MFLPHRRIFSTRLLAPATPHPRRASFAASRRSVRQRRPQKFLLIFASPDILSLAQEYSEKLNKPLSEKNPAARLLTDVKFRSLLN